MDSEIEDKGNDENEEAVASEVIADEPATTKTKDTPEKYRRSDGSVNAEGILADLRRAEERLEGLRKKLADTGEPRLAHRGKAPTLGTTSLPNGSDGETAAGERGEAGAEQNPGTASLAEEMAEELKGIDNKEDRAFAEKFIGLLGKNGLTKEKAADLLQGLTELYEPEDPKVFFKKEMEKLGADGKEVLGKVRMFRDAMRDAMEFNAEEIGALEQVTQTAEGVRLVGKILEKARQMDSGKFSSYRHGAAGGEDLSHSDRIRMYEKAYALQRTNPSESQAEIARLDRMFTQ
jgi:hypothetical protein